MTGFLFFSRIGLRSSNMVFYEDDTSKAGELDTWIFVWNFYHFLLY